MLETMLVLFGLFSISTFVYDTVLGCLLDEHPSPHSSVDTSPIIRPQED
jgi:hypothetical protein